jgi:Flp pilus assembly protein TadG
MSDRRKLRRRRLAQSGQSLVEVALLTPLLLALLLGAIELGRYAYISILVGNAAHAGAVYGAQSLPQSVDTAGIQQAADNDFQNNGQNVASLAVTSWVSCGCDNGGTITYQGQTTAMCSTHSNPNLDPTCSGGTAGHWVVIVNVTASGTFKALFNYPWIPSSISVSRISTMRVTQG